MKHGFRLKLKARGLKCKSRRIANVWLKQCEEKIAHEILIVGDKRHSHTLFDYLTNNR